MGIALLTSMLPGCLSPNQDRFECEEHEGALGLPVDGSGGRYIRFHMGNEEAYPVCVEVSIFTDVVSRRALSAQEPGDLAESYQETRELRLNASSIGLRIELTDRDQVAQETVELANETYIVISMMNSNIEVERYEDSPTFA